MGGWGRRPEGNWQRASKKIKLRPALVPKHQGRPHRRFCRLDSAASWTGPPPRWTPCQGESRNPERGRTRTETETPARRAIRSHAHGFGAVSLPGGGGGWFVHLILESLILKSKAEMTCFRRGVKAFYFRLWPSGRKFNALWHPSPTPSSSPKLHFKVVKKNPKLKVFQMLSFPPHPQKPQGHGKHQDPMLLPLE